MASFKQKLPRTIKSGLSLVYLSQSQACRHSTGPKRKCWINVKAFNVPCWTKNRIKIILVNINFDLVIFIKLVLLYWVKSFIGQLAQGFMIS